MWLAVLITVVAAAGNNIGKVLQKKATRGLPRLALERKVLAAYLSNSTWVTGLVIDVGGALLMLIAVAKAPAGQADVLEEMAFGIQAGSCFGMSAAACKTGFLLAATTSPLCAPLGIAVGVSLSSSGFFCQNRGFKEGRAVVVSTCADVANIVSGVLVGMMALGEELPQSRAARTTRLVSWVVILAGIIILVNAGKAAPLLLRQPMRFTRRWLKAASAPRPPARPPAPTHMTRTASVASASSGGSKYNDD